jgi:hypothetical protein
LTDDNNRSLRPEAVSSLVKTEESSDGNHEQETAAQGKQSEPTFNANMQNWDGKRGYSFSGSSESQDSGGVAAAQEKQNEPQTDNTEKKEWRGKRGYSSGGSSEPDFGESYVFDMNDVSTIDGSSKRDCLDRLHLTSMRNVMHANGDLTQAVVRLEVRII